MSVVEGNSGDRVFGGRREMNNFILIPDNQFEFTHLIGSSFSMRHSGLERSRVIMGKRKDDKSKICSSL
jgi:hypothetical protein